MYVGVKLGAVAVAAVGVNVGGIVAVVMPHYYVYLRPYAPHNSHTVTYTQVAADHPLC